MGRCLVELRAVVDVVVLLVDVRTGPVMVVFHRRWD